MAHANRSESLVILHISDLHIAPHKLEDVQVVLRAFWKDLDRLAEKPGFSPDLICFTGDIAQAGKKGEFELAAEHLFEPLLERFGLERERLLWVPGNHDVDRTTVSKVVERGLQSTDTYHDINEILRDETERARALRRLDAYAQFTRAYFGDAILDGQDPAYFTTRTLTIKGHTIGVACLNSAWRCSSDQDKGRLWIGDTQLRNALEQIQDADMKLALLHHPFDWLHENEQETAEDFCLREFDLVLRGHLHKSKVAYKRGPDGDNLILPTGALFQWRHWEGYSWIQIAQDHARIHLRQFVAERDCFVPDNTIADDGVWEIEGSYPNFR